MKPVKGNVLVRQRAAWLVLFLLGGHINPAAGQATERMVIGTDVACRAEPNRGSPVVRAWQLGDSFGVSSTESDSDSDVWYEQGLGSLRSCWTFGALTTPLESYRNPDSALLAVAEHALDSERDASFTHLVAVDNLLIQRERQLTVYRSAPEEMPPILQLRHLEILSSAARMVGSPPTARWDPLRLAWLLGSEDVRYFEPAGGYDVSNSRFWELYELYSDSPDADRIAWVAAQAPVYGDECYTECWLGFRLDPYMRYWSNIPQGDHIVEALQTGTVFAERASQYCAWILPAEFPRVDRERTRTLLGPIRRNLVDVTATEKDLLVARLDEVEKLCVTEVAEGLEDPQAIPALARALGTGSSIVSRWLAAFGEEAASSVIEVANASDQGTNEVGSALQTLRFMVEGSESQALSAGALDQIKETARRWLAARTNTWQTLNAAIDLAAVLDDPELLQVLEMLASDPEEIIVRGVDYPPFVESAQRHAADGLAGVPPLPRP